MTRTASPLRRAGACAIAVALLATATAEARLGDLDPAFGGDGVVELELPQSGLNAVAVQPDGKLVVAGHADGPSAQAEFVVARLDATGQLDGGFGTGGVVQWTGIEAADLYDVALEADGDVLVVGAAATGPAGLEQSPFPRLARLSPSGTLTELPLSGLPLNTASLRAVSALPDGRIAVAGFARGATTAPPQLLVGRLDANGAPDQTFSTDGYELVGIGSDARAWDLVVDAVGRMTVFGEATSSVGGVTRARPLALRFLAGGGRDGSFSGGQLLLDYSAPFAGAGRFTAVVPRGDELLAAGRIADGTQGILQRMSADGALSPGFGTAGAPSGAAVWTGEGEDVALTSIGGAVVAGQTANGMLQTAWLTAAGQPDAAAGGVRSHGVTLFTNAPPLGAAVGARDALTVAGTTATNRAVVARFAPNASPAAALSAPSQLDVGAPAEISAAGSSDPEGEPLRYAFDLNGDGSFEFDGGTNPLALRSFGGPGTYTVGVRVTDPRGGAGTAFRSIAVVAPPEPPPLPVLGKQGVARPVKGTIRYRLPGTKQFLPMVELTAIPNGTEIDARKGRVLLTVLHDASGRLDGGRFYAGRFIFRQGSGAVPLTTLKLTNGTLAKCGKRTRAAASSPLAVAARIPRSSGSRRLWGDGRGRFRTRGRYGAATVRGTKWLTDDRCDGTLVRVVRGKVDVQDLQRPRKPPVRVKAGQETFVKKRGS